MLLMSHGISKLTSLTDKMFELVHFNESDAVGLLATANCRDSFPTPQCGVYVYILCRSLVWGKRGLILALQCLFI